MALQTLPGLALLLVLMSACGRQGAAANEVSAGPDFGHYDRPLAPSVAGAQVEVSGFPAAWTRGSLGFHVSVTYRNAPANAGLMIRILRDVSRDSRAPLSESGGALPREPIPISGDGSVDVWFAGQAYSAPADGAVEIDLATGRHVFVAQMLNHRSPVVGDVPDVPGAQTLVEARSRPIVIRGALSQNEVREFGDALRRAFVRKLMTDLIPPGSQQPIQSLYRQSETRFDPAGVCADFTMIPPYAGRLRACAPNRLRSDVGLLLPSYEEVTFEGSARRE